MFHLLSVPLHWLDADKAKECPDPRWISVFVSYDKEGYAHYAKMSSDEPEHAESAIILHDMSGPERSSHHAQSLVSKSVMLSPAVDGDENVASYVSSAPYWVQDPIEIDGYRWVMSVYGPDMDSALEANRGIVSDGVGYVFLKDDLDINCFGLVGKFFLQLG
jgi:hypothetical protein